MVNFLQTCGVQALMSIVFEIMFKANVFCVFLFVFLSVLISSSTFIFQQFSKSDKQAW